MPLKKGEDVGEAIRELHTGPTYKRAVKKRGKKAAQRQAIAIALANRRKGKKRLHRGAKRSKKR